jgi:hypothetical protein
MPLNPSGLQSALEDMMGVHRPATAPAAAKRWSEIYDDYAKNATSPVGGSPISTAAGKAAMEGALVGAFSGKALPATLGALASAIIAYWTPTIFSGPVPGTTIPAAAGPALQAAIAAGGPPLAVSKAPAKAAAAVYAAAFDAASRLVLVSHPIPPGPPVVGPIS